MSTPQQPESHYNLNKLHVIFAIVALILLGSLGSLFMKDYSRDWKKYQYEFQGMEMEKTRIKSDIAHKELENNSEYKALLDELAQVRKDFPVQCADLPKLQANLKTLNDENILITQNLKFANAQLDASRFRYEEALAHEPHKIVEAKKVYTEDSNKAAKLRIAVDKSEASIKETESSIKSCEIKLTELEKKERSFTSQVDLLQRKLKRIDPAEQSLVNQFAGIIRDLPVIDMSNPTVKIEQVVLKNITEDVNITLVPRVDRCTTCHLGIANPDYKNAAQPFRTHPNLELFVGKDSAHPLDDFGCTVCHAGRGRGTSFVSTAHTPADEKQKEEWVRKYGWFRDHHWEHPMLPVEHTQASCFKCHSGETTIKGADKLNLGMQVIEKAGCYNCHTIEKFRDWPKSGPNLNLLASKMSKNWAYKWIADPQSFRPNTWMPSYFNQSNNSDPESVTRSQQEIHAMVEYLFSKSEKFTMEKFPRGDARKGEELVSSLGCFACHQVQKDPIVEKLSRATLSAQHGPNLIGMGSKTSKEWIFNWLKDPNRYHAETRMPNLRLSDDEAADIAEYLVSDKISNFDSLSVPKVNEEIINAITGDFLKKEDGLTRGEARLAKMSLQEKLVYSGEKLIGHYGCFSCHQISGFENRKPIGVELTEEGSKPVDKFDFGFIHIDHSRHAWFDQKLKDPRIFDKNKIREPLDRLVMPNFNLSEEEASAATTALMGLVSDKTVEKMKKPRTENNLALEQGEKIVRQLNCQACHKIDGEGGSIQSSVKDWLVKFDNRSDTEAQAMINSFSPPNLIGEGKKVHTQWLFEFLHEPSTIRPWLKVRMPTYKLNAAHLNALVKYFNALDQEEYPFTDVVDTKLDAPEFAAAEKLFSNEYFGCAQCHIVAGKMPSGSSDSWAPDFALAKKRLKPEWIIHWLKNPADLLPGTKMPTYFDPSSFDESGPNDILNGDEMKQIKALRNYLLSIVDHPPIPQPASTPAQQ